MGLFNFFSRPPSLKSLELERYLFSLSLDRLSAGVDNVHIDVHISAQVRSTLQSVAYLSVIRRSRSEPFFKDYRKKRLESEKERLKQLCADVLLDGINRSKSKAEVQVDFLGQVSLAKLFLEEIKNQYGKLIAHFENLIRTYELSRNRDQVESFRIKEKLLEIKRRQKRILRRVGEELFHILVDVHVGKLKNIRESNFPVENILPHNFLVNPMLFADSARDDFFLIREYVLFSQRAQDPDNYDSLKRIIHGLLAETDLDREEPENQDQLDESDPREQSEQAALPPEGNRLDQWIMAEENIDRMFNSFDTREEYQRAKSRKEAKETLGALKSRSKVQEKLLNYFYRKFKKAKLIERIAATQEMKSVYGKYCPPLQPWQVLEFIVKRSSRKPIARKLKRLKTFYHRTFSLGPLNNAIRRVKRSSTAENKLQLLIYLKHFFRYNRDLHTFRLLKEAMDAVALVKDEKILTLSRENHSLYEFLLPDERVKTEKPIINHVIIKADIRGSTDITYMMRTRGLNPASYFSLNFFDPISEILSDYDGSKEFIEGDAIILSVVEHEESPQNWYSVARACGLAVRMLNIVQQYNFKSKKHKLPVLELGIGICHEQRPPAFLFDGDSRIMISPAINLADRLSGCDKRLRRRFREKSRMFNLFVFQNASDEKIEDTKDDLFLRYNVNGIELDKGGFEKLSREIHLKSIHYPIGNRKVKLHFGKVPTLSGKYQQLIIREASILEIKPETMEVTGKTSEKFYEVCTHPEIHKFIRSVT